MPHYNAFTRYELSQIRRLLEEKIGKPKDEQLKIRNELRDVWGFYISDFRPDRPYTSNSLDKDLADGFIEQIQMALEEDYITG